MNKTVNCSFCTMDDCFYRGLSTAATDCPLHHARKEEPWDISKAVKGEILTYEYEDEDSMDECKFIFIFRYQSDKYPEVVGYFANVVCKDNVPGKIYINDNSILSANYVRQATTEEKQLLLSSMHEQGYVMDYENLRVVQAGAENTKYKPEDFLKNLHLDKTEDVPDVIMCFGGWTYIRRNAIVRMIESLPQDMNIGEFKKIIDKIDNV